MSGKMKRVSAIFIGMIFISVYSCREGNRNETGTFVADADYVQIVLFHLAQRCESCNAVEEETILLLENEYTDELASGTVKFIALNFQSKHGREAARLLQASGQTLFVVRGDSIDDLTSPAFRDGSTHPEYYREAVRKALDQALDKTPE